MRGRGDDGDLVVKIGALSGKGGGAVDANAVKPVVEAVLASLSGDMSVADLKLYRELEQLAHYIQVAKREIADLRPHDIISERIPAAADELDAVVDHTAEATGTILDAAERLEKLAPAMARETAGAVAVEVTRIYEACNFQDITGQRITKVVKTLKYLEQKIDALLGAFGDGIAGAPKPEHSPAEDEFAKLMTGPELPAAANNQDDIDAILASMDLP